MQLRHPVTGLSLMVTYELEMSCERCKKKQKPEKCTHKLNVIPPWKSKEKQDINKVDLSSSPLPLPPHLRDPPR